MNFEREIEKKLIALIEGVTYISDNSISVKRFGSITGIDDVLSPIITTEVRPRVNINGGLWNVTFVLDVLIPLSVDDDGLISDALYGVIVNAVATVKATPSTLSNTGYDVDGLIDIDESGRPEFGAIRLATLSAKLFLSY